MKNKKVMCIKPHEFQMKLMSCTQSHTYIVFDNSYKKRIIMEKRLDIFDAIDEERIYQDEKFGGYYKDIRRNTSDWLIDIEIHLNKAKLANYSGNSSEALAEVRKIAALAVGCMEYQGLVKR